MGFSLNAFPVERQLDMMDCGPACLKIITNLIHYNTVLDIATGIIAGDTLTGSIGNAIDNY